jgi:membrane protease YdiL (CAAX protease family)
MSDFAEAIPPNRANPVRAPSPTLKAKARWVFRGPNGIRAGWSVLIFIAIMALCLVAVRLIGHAILGHRPPPPTGDLSPARMLVQEVILLLVVLIPTWAMSRIERRPVWSYGLAPRRAVALCSIGLAGGLASLSLLVAALDATGALTFAGIALNTQQAIIYGLVWAFGFFLVGVAEETIFRGYVQTTLARGIGFWPAAIGISLLFAASHYGNPGETPLGLAGVVAASLALTLLLYVTGSLWLSIGFHAAWDWSQSYLYGTPDSGIMMQGHLFITHAAGNVSLSGGPAGPEGSLLATPVLIATLLGLVFIVRQAGLAPRGVRAD